MKMMMISLTFGSERSNVWQVSCQSSIPRPVHRKTTSMRRQDDVLKSLGWEKKNIWRCLAASTEIVGPPACVGEQELQGLSTFLDSLKWNSDGLVTVIVQVSKCQMHSKEHAVFMQMRPIQSV